MDLNRRFSELVGLIDKDFLVTDSDDIPDFISDPRLVLREMMKRKDFHGDFGFQQVIGGPEYDKIDLKYIRDTTGLLVKVAIEWMEKEKP